MSYGVYNSNRYGTPSIQRNSSPSLNGHEIPLKKGYFSLIQNGKKTVEGRINNGLFRNAREDDVVTFINGSSKARCRIIAVAIYKSFREMLESEGLENCLPGTRSLDEGVKIYNSIPGYAEKADRFGVVALKIVKIEDAILPTANIIPVVRSHTGSAISKERDYSRSSSSLVRDRREKYAEEHDYRNRERDRYPSERSRDLSSKDNRDYDRDQERSFSRTEDKYDDRDRERTFTRREERDKYDERNYRKKEQDKDRAEKPRDEAVSRKRKFDDVEKDMISALPEKGSEQPLTKKARPDQENPKEKGEKK